MVAVPAIGNGPPPTSAWRVTPLPPYLPAAAVLAESLWPELPERPAPALPPAPPALLAGHKTRLDAEQEAT